MGCMYSINDIENVDLSGLETGDIILFETGCNHLFSLCSLCISCCLASRYSHVAMVLKDPTYIDSELKGVYIIESTGGLLRNVVDDKYKVGVAIHKLKDSIIEHNSIFTRKLNIERDEHFNMKIKQIYNNIKDKPYDINPLHWLGAIVANITEQNNTVVDIIKKTDNQNEEWFLCSALIANIYVKLGVLSPDTPWTIITPVDFSINGIALKYINNCSLGPEIRLN